MRASLLVLVAVLAACGSSGDASTDAGHADTGSDAASATDTGTGADSGTTMDSGASSDTGTGVDAGTATDSGTGSDTGTAPDSGPPPCTPGDTTCGPGMSCCIISIPGDPICEPTCTDPGCFGGCHPIR